MNTGSTRDNHSGRPATWQERLLVLGGFGIAAAATAVSLMAGAGVGPVGGLWWLAIGWAVLAALALAVRDGLRHGDWSAFRNWEFPDNGDLVDWSSRTGRYAWMREWEDRHRFDDDHLR